jgi:hypothetical protein
VVCAANLPASQQSITVAFSDDAAVLATDSDPAIASQELQTNTATILYGLKWTMETN